MTRRKPYSKVEKQNRVQSKRVKGNGDILFRGFECPNPECEQFIYARDDAFENEFKIACPTCGEATSHDGEQKLYDYSLFVTPEGETETSIELQTGFFVIRHLDYVNEAQRYKYCIVCNKLKPADFFDNHSARSSHKQGECRLCKKSYNSIKNRTRIAEQHREAANRRRIFVELASSHRIDMAAIRDRFDEKCFNCKLDLSEGSQNESHLDHTLPVSFLWPLNTDNATLLCSRCNGEKTNKWPNAFYSEAKLRELAVMTGIPFDTLGGRPQFNPEAIKELQNADKLKDMLVRYARYESEVFRLRNRILMVEGVDVFADAGLNPTLISRANTVGGGQMEE